MDCALFKDVRTCPHLVCLNTQQSCLRLALPARNHDPGIIYPDLLRSANISIFSLCWPLMDALFKPFAANLCRWTEQWCLQRKKREEQRREESGRNQGRSCEDTSVFVWENCCLSQSACTKSVPTKKLPTQLMAGMWNRMACQGDGGRGRVNWKLRSLCGHYKETWDVLTQQR